MNDEQYESILKVMNSRDEIIEEMLCTILEILGNKKEMLEKKREKRITY